MSTGNFLEDFSEMGAGHVFHHPNPTTVTDGTVSNYKGRVFQPTPLYNSGILAQKAFGWNKTPIDPVLTFHLVISHTVPDISFNAVANLGYRNGIWGAPVFPGDTLKTRSTLLGLKENSNGKAGIVHVRTAGFNQREEKAFGFERWVMVHKRDAASSINPFGEIPDGTDILKPEDLSQALEHYKMRAGSYDASLSSQQTIWEDLEVGQVIAGALPIAVDDSHKTFTMDFNNIAKVHFQSNPLVYGGYAISIARNTTAFGGLDNAFLVAMNGGQHINPVREGHILSSRAVIKDLAEVNGNPHIGLARISFEAARDIEGVEGFQWDGSKVRDVSKPAQVLRLDTWGALPRRRALAA